eukprot:TRINITY_DN27499_c0_g1_i1.p1 TRINITY_DN27499_c0_g1~~TRINITY_DN27499_c0_g1_i1.p1  ORF type:complete len:705 (+),score=200.91 TRINITY_DN27499_c0_g1_i1:75-2189(+)
MVFLGTHVHLRPFLRHEVDACHRLKVPVDSAVALRARDGRADKAFAEAPALAAKKGGGAQAAVLDVRDGRVKTAVGVDEAYFGEESLKEAAGGLVESLVVDYLTGRDVAVLGFGARMSGKTQLLFGDLSEGDSEGKEDEAPDDDAPGASRHPSTVDECIVLRFAEHLWGALDGEHTVLLSAVQLMPDGVSLNLLGDAEEISSYEDYASTFVGPVDSTQALRQVLANTFYNLVQVRDNALGSAGTTVFSLRVDRAGEAGAHSQNSPVAMFVEVEPLPPAATSPLAGAVRKLAGLHAAAGSPSPPAGGDQDGDPFSNLPWGVLLILEALRARSWSTKVLCCVSPSPTASTASCNHLQLAAQLVPPARALSTSPLPASAVTLTVSQPEPTAGAGLLSNTSSPAAGTPVDEAHHPLPSRDVVGVLALDTANGEPPANGAAPAAAAATGWAGQKTPLELAHMVSMLRAEMAILQREYSGERLKHSREAEEAATKTLVLETTAARVTRENEELKRELESLRVKVDLAVADKKAVMRELEAARRDARGLEYENQALHRQVDGMHRRVEKARETSPTRASARGPKTPFTSTARRSNTMRSASEVPPQPTATFSRQATHRRSSPSAERRGVTSTFAAPTTSFANRVSASRSHSLNKQRAARVTESPHDFGRRLSLVGASAAFARPKLSNASPAQTPRTPVTPSPQVLRNQKIR